MAWYWIVLIVFVICAIGLGVLIYCTINKMCILEDNEDLIEQLENTDDIIGY